LPLLLFRKVREDRQGLFGVAVLVITGFLLNRLNVSITGMEASSGVHYFPRWTEVAVTLSIVGVGFLLFSLAVRYLNVMEVSTGHGTRDTGYGTRDTGYGTRDTGYGTRDTGYGTRDTGSGTRDSAVSGVRGTGHGIRDSPFGNEGICGSKLQRTRCLEEVSWPHYGTL
jgi:hypothetical protein